MTSKGLKAWSSNSWVNQYLDFSQSRAGIHYVPDSAATCHRKWPWNGLSIIALWKENPSYKCIQARDQRVNQKRNNFHIKWSFFLFFFFIVSSERIVALQVEQFSFLWISRSIYESHFTTHLHAVNLCFKVLSFTLIMIIYSLFRKGPLLVSLTSTALPQGSFRWCLLSHGSELRHGRSFSESQGSGLVCGGNRTGWNQESCTLSI